MNLGSTSFKTKLFEITGEEKLIATGNIEIGENGRYTISTHDVVMKGVCKCLTHADAMDFCIRMAEKIGVNVDLMALDAVGYKAVHGGKISESRIVDDELLTEMEKMSIFAPAHNPIYMQMMRYVRERYPFLTQIACFETAFHATQPLYRAVYGVPYEWIGEYGVRRYGFHGSSHSFIAWKMSMEAPKLKKLISCHLGGSSSICAIEDGKSIAVSMGATPQSGLFNNNRVGDFDVFCLPVLAEKMGGINQVMSALSEKSGFMGLSGVSNDFREVLLAAKSGNEKACLAVDAFIDNIVGYIGMFTAYMGGLDALVFTGGIGFNSDWVRSSVCDRLGFVNAKLDSEKNEAGTGGCISTASSNVFIWAFETNEELIVARRCMEFLDHMNARA